MCSYWRCSLALTPRMCLPRGMSDLPSVLRCSACAGLAWPDRFLSRLQHRADLLLRHVQHVAGPVVHRLERVGGAFSSVPRLLRRELEELLAPVHDGNPPGDHAQDESDHPLLLSSAMHADCRYVRKRSARKIRAFLPSKSFPPVSLSPGRPARPRGRIPGGSP